MNGDANGKVIPVDDAGDYVAKSRPKTVTRLDSMHENDNKPITLSWENIDVYTPEVKPRNWPVLARKGAPSRNIVKKVSGIAKPGSLLAIMGASGAGKTTLLNVLNYRNRGTLKITGDVKINGSVVETRSALSSLSGYVQQEDLFIGTLKVGELLSFQANLRMDDSYTKEQKQQRVEDIMNDLNLKKCEKTIIGEPDQGVKGISGGERRRLAFACELITNPMLLFCDEPTSGLDSFMAMTIVESMRRLAEQGKTIICTIHQPSSEVFEKFDRLLLMAEGRVAYLGDLSQCQNFFASNGLLCPDNYNPADFYIQNLAMVPANKEESLARIAKICDNFDKSNQAQSLAQDIKNANTMPSNPQTALHLVNKTLYKVNVFKQTEYLVWRSWITSWRDMFTTRVAAIQTVLIAVLLGLIYLRSSYDQAGAQNLTSVLFLVIVNSSFTNMLGVLHSFPAEIPIFMREHQNGMYAVLPYYLSKMITELPRLIVLVVSYVAIVYWMVGLNSDVGRFFICVVVVVITAFTSVAFGAFLSSLAPNVDAAIGFAAPTLMPLMIFSGTFINNSSIPKYFIWIRYISWFNYANELLITNQWHDVTGLTCSTSSRCFTTGNELIDYYGMSTDHTAVNYVALFCLLIGFRVLAFLVLLIKSYLY